MVDPKGPAQKPGAILDLGLTRRQAVQTAGLAVLGLTFAKPIISTFYPKPAFANYQITDTSNPGSSTAPNGGTQNGNGSSNLSSGGGSNGGGGGQSSQPLSTENPNGVPSGRPSDPAAVLDPLGDNLVRLGEFSNRSKKWNFFDTRFPPGASKRIPELVPGQVYFIEVKGHQQVMLNGRLRSLYAGANYIVW